MSLQQPVVHTLRATSFATRQDLAEFARLVTAGMSARKALDFGDNGVGAWGTPTWKPHGIPMCALPSGIGSSGLIVFVTIPGVKADVRVTCTDESPAGVIDLNPAALVAFGYDADADINIPNVIVKA